MAIADIDYDQRTDRVSWDERLRPVKEHFQSARDADWFAALQDFDFNLLGQVLRDILRVGNSPVRRGQRALIERDEGVLLLRQLLGDDYSVEQFPAAFKHLTRGAPLAEVAETVGLTACRCKKLLDGFDTPTFEEMQAVADAYRKAPEFFLEYRVGFILTIVAEHLNTAPEASVGIVRHLSNNR